MANDYFRFKQFTVWQDKCAMKVGTDGTLLGAWVGVDTCQSILDVGTGTGLIALMLAQRNREAKIDALDIDEDACSQAKANVEASPFSGRMRIIHASFPVYASGTTLRYDLIVSNPPYFVHSLKNPIHQRSIARHTDSLSLEELVSKGRELLRPNGRLALILPAGREDELKRIAHTNGLNRIRQTSLIPVPGAKVKRVLTELSVNTRLTSCTTDTLLIEEVRHQYTPAYKELTKDFYLNFPI
jgi:tRNA1Val (adenine37-N6)-methyltransferase